jgi:hypothetical protein
MYEEGPAFLDNAMGTFSGTISRSNVDDGYDEFLDDQVKAIQSDIAVQEQAFD